jgi:hypothetical protein
LRLDVVLANGVPEKAKVETAVKMAKASTVDGGFVKQQQ